MQQNATPELTAAQENSLAALLAGKSITDAAQAANVDRTTVHRWLKDDHVFRAALNRRRRDLREQLQSRLMNLADKALDAVEKAISETDSKAALTLLRGLGLLSGNPPSIGSDDPLDLAADARQRELVRSLMT